MADVNDKEVMSGRRRRPTKAGQQKIVSPPAGTRGGTHCPTVAVKKLDRGGVTTLTMADVNNEDATSGGRRRPTKAGKQKIVFPPSGTHGGTQRPAVVVETIDENSSAGEEPPLGSDTNVASKDEEKDPKGRPVVLGARQRAIRRAAAARGANKESNAKATRRAPRGHPRGGHRHAMAS
jgi:hypothetical protein